MAIPAGALPDAIDGSGLRGPIAAARFAVVDVETSGLRPIGIGSCRSASCVPSGDGTVLDRWDTLLRAPWRPIGGRDIHGLSRRTLGARPGVRQVAEELVPRFDGCIVCAHNAEFDWPFLARGLRRAGVTVPDALRLCTLRLLALARPRADSVPPPGRSVPALRHPPDRAHDAAADAEATPMLLPGFWPGGGHQRARPKLLTDDLGADRTTSWTSAGGLREATQR